MITLHGFGPALGLPDPSPFVLKTHLLLRLHKVEFDYVPSMKNLQIAPKGKLPFIKDDEKIICDSFFINEYLKEHYSNNLDNHLTEEQIAEAHFISKSIEENFYWCIVYFRWIYEKNWKIIKKLFFGKMPFPFNKIIPRVANKDVQKALHGHGLGRHSEEEILFIAEQHLKALNTFLGGKQFCFGDKSSSLDATVYAFLAQVLLATIDSPLSEIAKKHQHLVDYCNNMQSRYYET